MIRAYSFRIWPYSIGIEEDVDRVLALVGAEALLIANPVARVLTLFREPDLLEVVVVVSHVAQHYVLVQLAGQTSPLANMAPPSDPA